MEKFDLQKVKKLYEIPKGIKVYYVSFYKPRRNIITNYPDSAHVIANNCLEAIQKAHILLGKQSGWESVNCTIHHRQKQMFYTCYKIAKSNESKLKQYENKNPNSGN